VTPTGIEPVSKV